MTAPLPPDTLCERCCGPVRRGERVFRFAHLVGSNLLGDTTWAYTYLHPYDRDEGCVRNPASIWD